MFNKIIALLAQGGIPQQDPGVIDADNPDTYSDSGAALDADAIGIPKIEASDNTVQNVLNYVFALIGAISVLMIILGGVRYIVSSGDPQRISSSKNTIIYAIIGLIIAVSSAIIVNFIFSVVESNPANSQGVILWLS